MDLVLEQVRWESDGGLRRLEPGVLEVGSGKVAVVLARSAAEADRFAEVLLGRAPLSGGKIKINGTDVPLIERWDIALIPPDGGLFPHLSVVENIRSGRRGISMNAVKDRAAAFGLQGYLDRRPGDLTHDQRIGVALTRATCVNSTRVLVVEDRAGAVPCRQVVATVTHLFPDLPVVVVTDDATQAAVWPHRWTVTDA
ncbi:hypothetical protein GCM10009677_10970 [Sphaerisporangium rubeum]|uniref:ABC-type thiamine transport system ATPase subunit n=1 Tax=Sphaerisporangium rubeum TaxID=321317 RepID=A0A7X0M6X0_9ACTN|nr:hypothetical protein [Sphaerisporangium rubeum]MBB6472281.1 ABC-type thiamine transport system ATPase subunit [Sphaerisporangium rubeum]